MSSLSWMADLATEEQSPVGALQRYWGYRTFRPLQEDAINAVLAGQDVLLVMPTGGGKSLCYQVPAACGTGMALIISPLIALMEDQVAAARQAGMAAAALHSHISEDEQREVRSQATNGRLQLLYVSPERAVLGDLVSRLGTGLSLVAVDEAHCVSHWGHDFRPEYRQLKAVLAQVPQAARMALTATATPQVQDDIATQLGLRQPLRLLGHVDRPNLIYRALPRHDGTAQVLDVIRRHEGEGGIVYAQTRKEVERLNETLKGRGVRCAAYHAGLSPQERSDAQHAFVSERLDVIVATIAFGMGIDRSNVRYVIHANSPKSIEHYQQEAGRAGRDGLPAECVLLYSGADLVTHRFLATREGPLQPDRQRSLEHQLRDIGRFAVAPVCRHRMLTEHFGQPYPATAEWQLTARDTDTVRGIVAPASAPEAEGCGACDVCLGETQELPPADALVTAQKIISAVWRMGGRFGAAHVASVLLGRKSEMAERNSHESLSVFGLLSEAGEPAIRSWIDQLVVQGFLDFVERDQYTFLTMTAAGRDLCKVKVNEDRQVRLGRHERTKRASKTRSAGAKEPVQLRHRDRDLFESLRALRRLFAEEQDVPPYVVFSDATLTELATERPTIPSDMLRIKGVGETKLVRYGRAFMAVIGGASPQAAFRDEDWTASLDAPQAAGGA